LQIENEIACWKQLKNSPKCIKKWMLVPFWTKLPILSFWKKLLLLDFYNELFPISNWIMENICLAATLNFSENFLCLWFRFRPPKQQNILLYHSLTHYWSSISYKDCTVYAKLCSLLKKMLPNQLFKWRIGAAGLSTQYIETFIESMLIEITEKQYLAYLKSFWLFFWQRDVLSTRLIQIGNTPLLFSKYWGGIFCKLWRSHFKRSLSTELSFRLTSKKWDECKKRRWMTKKIFWKWDTVRWCDLTVYERKFKTEIFFFWNNELSGGSPHK
jgi:hypothetical protein